MKILVAVASRHGSTREIADAIADELRASGHAVARRDAHDVDLDDAYDAAIVGSAIYLGSWLADARQFVTRNRARLATVPVWLFSSGPLGADHSQPKENPIHLAELMQLTGAREHRIWVGKLDRSQLGLGERLIARMVRAPEGDFRDWGAVRAWAREIALVLAGSEVEGG